MTLGCLITLSALYRARASNMANVFSLPEFIFFTGLSINYPKVALNGEFLLELCVFVSWKGHKNDSSLHRIAPSVVAFAGAGLLEIDRHSEA